MDKVRDKITFHVISHTHWDREWYLPFEYFRIELVELVDNLLDILEQNKEFIFHLDGQSIILQDYLEIKPYKKEQIRKFVKSGNLLIGPWYILSDQFLTSGEATIRNLLYGIRDSKQFSDVMLVGYCPDQFGQIGQLPQIFKGFNINSAIVGRGIQDSMAEHIWYGLNGDSVLTVSLTHWYNNAQRLPDSSEKLNKYVDKIYETQAKTSLSGHVLLMNGCDHLFPQGNLNQILKSSNGNQKWQLSRGSLPKALVNIAEKGETQDYPICFGELRDDNNKYILAGTLSSRVYLKLENYRCQTYLEKIIEPLSALLVLSRKTHYPYDEIKYGWKMLIQNHAHDSICGCSIDEVHKEMEVRFLKVRQVLDKLQEKLLSNLNDCRDVPAGRLYLQLINLSSYHRDDIIEADLEFPLGPPAEHPSASPTVNKKEIKGIYLKHKNKKIDFEILESTKAFKMVRSKNEVPLLQAIQKIKVLFKANVEPFSICTYGIDAQVETLQRSVSIGAYNKSNVLEFENQYYKLNVNKDGTISVVLKENDCKFENIHYLTIEDDIGDEYNFVPNVIARKDEVLTKQSHKSNMQSEIASVALLPRNDTSKDLAWDVKVVEENNFRKKILLLTSDISELDIKIEIICYKNTNRIDFKTQITNKFKNKRIRLHFPTALNVGYLYADTPFGVIQRSRPPLNWTNYAASQPLHNWIDHSNEKIGLAFFGNGLADYELYEDGNGFAVTLIRAVGRLSNVKSHSLIETPDAQCNRDVNFSYAIYPHLKDWSTSNIQKEQLIYQTPVIINQSDSSLDTLSLINTPCDLIVSSIKRAEDNENLYIIRVFNPLNKAFETCQIKFNFLFKNLYLLNFNEDKIGTFSNDNDQISFNIKPYEVLTLGVEV